ncbi:hypothetical protein GCM10009647_068480 [Streptomyces sanglieri]
MSVGSTPPSYKGHRYPVEVISHCVWLYFRIPLSFREVEELMLAARHHRLQRFLSAFSGISPHFRPHRHLMTASAHRAEMTVRFAIWDQITQSCQPAHHGLTTGRKPTMPQRAVRHRHTQQLGSATWMDLMVPVSLDAGQGPWTCLRSGYGSRNSSARGTNTSWCWKIPPCPASR